MDYKKKLRLSAFARILTFSITLLFTALSFAQINRVEPPFWYAGMNLSSVQIMFYGKNIGQYEVAVSNNVVIENIKKTENPNYVFVTIDTKNIAPTELTFSFKSKNKVVFTKNYSIKARREN
ncbi:cyclomaltodextrinase N-terminal domain-containing protein, partial [Nitratireductor aestuarii]